MNEAVVTGIFTVAGVLITAITAGIFQYIQIRARNTVTKEKQTIIEMIDNLEVFHHLEEEYIGELISYRTEKGETTFVTHDAIVKEFRKRLRQRDKYLELKFSPSSLRYYRKVFNIEKE